MGKSTKTILKKINVVRKRPLFPPLSLPNTVLEKVKEITGVEVPKYYNPQAINPLRYAEQIKKRQLLFGRKKPEQGNSEQISEAPVSAQPIVEEKSALQSQHQQPSSSGLGNLPPVKSSYNNWESTNFGSDKTNEKFRRLMGIKNAGTAAGAAPPPSSSSSTNLGNSGPTSNASKWFDDQEKQYEKARAITHTQRGLGLGFSGMAAAAAANPALQPTQSSSESKLSIPEKRPLAFVKK